MFHALELFSAYAISDPAPCPAANCFQRAVVRAPTAKLSSDDNGCRIREIATLVMICRTRACSGARESRSHRRRSCERLAARRNVCGPRRLQPAAGSAAARGTAAASESQRRTAVTWKCCANATSSKQTPPNRGRADRAPLERRWVYTCLERACIHASASAPRRSCCYVESRAVAMPTRDSLRRRGFASRPNPPRCPGVQLWATTWVIISRSQVGHATP